MSEMKDYGLQYVNPDLVTIDPPLAEGWQTSKDGGGGTPREDFVRRLDNASEVKSLIEQGYEKNDFDRLRESDDPREKAIGESYNMYWGDNPIKVHRDGEDLKTDGGRHRLSVAQDRGQHSLPMRVYAPEDDPEFAGKKYDAARHPLERKEAREENRMTREGSPGGYTPEQHNPIEAKETAPGANPEKKPQLDTTPDQRENLHQAQGQDHTMDGGSNASPSNDAAMRADKSSDPMDGSDGAKDSRAVEKSDAMDGAGDSSKKEPIDSASKELPEINGEM